jgi:hypothetical protein
MADATADRFIVYGDKRFKLDEGMTLEDAKGIMSRHFPELADPAVETKKEDGATVYVFAKKAGRKGARSAAGLDEQLAALGKLRPTPILDDVALRAGAVLIRDDVDLTKLPIGLDELGRQLRAEAQEVARVASALGELPSAVVPSGSVLL